MSKLTIHHLARRLPYGLRVHSNKPLDNYGYEYSMEGVFTNSGIIIKMDEIVEDDKIHHLTSEFSIDEFKPILHPLSDLTKLIKHGEEFVPIERLNKESENGRYKYDDAWDCIQLLTKYNENGIDGVITHLNLI